MSDSLGKSVATFALAFLAGIVGAVLGWIVTGFAADALLAVGGMSDINGGRAMVAFFTFAPFGAIAGLILGVWLVLRRRIGKPGFARVAGYSALVVLLCAGLGAATAGYFYLANDILVPTPQLNSELRFPPNTPLPDKLEGVDIDLNTDKNTMPGIWNEMRTEDGRTTASGSVDLYFRTSHRLLVLRVPGQPDRIFQLNLKSNPKAAPEFGPWQALDFVDDDPNGQARKAGPDEGYEIRYRVERND